MNISWGRAERPNLVVAERHADAGRAKQVDDALDLDPSIPSADAARLRLHAGRLRTAFSTTPPAEPAPAADVYLGKRG